MKALTKDNIKLLVRSSRSPINAVVNLYEYVLDWDIDGPLRCEGYPTVSANTDQFICQTAHGRFRSQNNRLKWEWAWFNFGFKVDSMEDWKADPSTATLVAKVETRIENTNE